MTVLYNSSFMTSDELSELVLGFQVPQFVTGQHSLHYTDLYNGHTLAHSNPTSRIESRIILHSNFPSYFCLQRSPPIQLLLPVFEIAAIALYRGILGAKGCWLDNPIYETDFASILEISSSPTEKHFDLQSLT
ncbi:hypothetical protein SDJN03_10348, partial [Cucurbita argyrosperma subsp. sororia]